MDPYGKYQEPRKEKSPRNSFPRENLSLENRWGIPENVAEHEDRYTTVPSGSANETLMTPRSSRHTIIPQQTFQPSSPPTGHYWHQNETTQSGSSNFNNQNNSNDRPATGSFALASSQVEMASYYQVPDSDYNTARNYDTQEVAFGSPSTTDWSNNMTTNMPQMTPNYSMNVAMSQQNSSLFAPTTSNARFTDLSSHMGDLLLATPGNQRQSHSFIPQVPTSTAPERRKPNWKLDKAYKVIKPKNCDDFYKTGRVFSTLWIEPAGYGGRDPKRNGTQYTKTGYLEGVSYSEIRRYVVLQANYGSAQCSPIHTYNNKGTFKENLPMVNEHAIIYTSSEEPRELQMTLDDGRTIYENLSKDAIKVVREQDHDTANLGIFSRLNYSKIYTVEYSALVLNIGMVHQGSMMALLKSSWVKPRKEPPQPPRQHRSSNEKSKHHHHSSKLRESKNKK